MLIWNLTWKQKINFLIYLKNYYHIKEKTILYIFESNTKGIYVKGKGDHNRFKCKSFNILCNSICHVKINSLIYFSHLK